ncbi:hypothetical protein MXB_1221 [Myxobolus squamalis]|nr:hypothetical protein MXB_1221 [Myxobolus squamalis]
MRGTLIDWMSDVAHGYHYSPETLFMAVNYLDRFLSIALIELCQLQLVATGCLFIAAYNFLNSILRKLNNIIIPQIEDFVYISDTEKWILSVLAFDLVVPTVLFFAELYASYFQKMFIQEKNLLLIESLCEYILLDYVLINSYYPSVLAAAIIIASAYKCGN